MCKSIAEGGKRCRCADPEKQEKRRAAAAKRQAEYMRKKRAATTVTPDPLDAAPETSPEAKTTVTSAAPEPENPFANFAPETEPLTDEQRDAERERLEDFFARKLADPTAQWDAAPKPEPAAHGVEKNFLSFMAELRAP